VSSTARRLFLAIALLALAGMIVSGVSLAHHFGHSKTSYCDFGDTFNCDMVNRSTYSSVMGIPVALIGLLGYAGLLAASTLYRNRTEIPLILLIAALAGLGFALYLTYIEAYVLAVWCILCLSSLTAISLITVLSCALVWHQKRSS
jgi:vitamin-K-epoxide reductase (warfarin-sensitive)